MKPENMETLLDMLSRVLASSDAKVPEELTTRISGLKQALADAKLFKDIPKHLTEAIDGIEDSAEATKASVIILAVENIKLANRVAMLEKKGTTLEAKIDGQRDRMRTIEESIDSLRQG